MRPVFAVYTNMYALVLHIFIIMYVLVLYISIFRYFIYFYFLKKKVFGTWEVRCICNGFTDISGCHDWMVGMVIQYLGTTRIVLERNTYFDALALHRILRKVGFSY